MVYVFQIKIATAITPAMEAVWQRSAVNNNAFVLSSMIIWK